MTGPVGVTGFPQESFAEGGVGVVWASATQGTVDPSSGGRLKPGGDTL